jgi:hypothetical protein
MALRLVLRAYRCILGYRIDHFLGDKEINSPDREDRCGEQSHR